MSSDNPNLKNWTNQHAYCRGAIGRLESSKNSISPPPHTHNDVKNVKTSRYFNEFVPMVIKGKTEINNRKKPENCTISYWHYLFVLRS